MGLRNRKIIRWMLTTLWIAIGAGTLILLVAAVRIKDAKKCAGVYINIRGVNNIFFVDKKDILDSITTKVGMSPMGEPVRLFDLEKMEGVLTNNIWVKSAQLFFDNNEMLQINVLEREPVARIFTTAGTTFYIDSSIEMLPLSEKFSARLPVFTDFPTDNIVLAKADSDLLNDIKNISIAIQKDPFSMAMIDQIDITPQRKFEMVPKMGNEIIEFGDATDIEQKLRNLQLFYKNVITKAGWNYYSVIDLEYKGQIVARIKGAADRAADSLKTLQLMQAIVANAKSNAEDSAQTTSVSDTDNTSTDTDMLQQSVERDEEEDTTVQQSSSPTIAADKKPVVIKPKNNLPASKPKSAAANPTTKKLIVKQKPIVKQNIIIKKSTTIKQVKPKPPTKPKPAEAAPKQKTINDY